MSARAEDAARVLSREQPTTADAAVPTPANNGSADAEGVEIPAPEPSGNKNLLCRRHVQDAGHLEHDHVLRKGKHVTSGAKGLNVPWGAGGLDWSGFRVGPGAWGGNHAKGKSLGAGCA